MQIKDHFNIRRTLEFSLQNHVNLVSLIPVSVWCTLKLLCMNFCLLPPTLPSHQFNIWLPFIKIPTLKEKIESFWPEKLSHFDLKSWVILTWKVEPFWPEKLSHFDLKSWLILTWKVDLFWPEKLNHFNLKSWIILTWKVESFWPEKFNNFDLKSRIILT